MMLEVISIHVLRYKNIDDTVCTVIIVKVYSVEQFLNYCTNGEFKGAYPS